ncbi:MAG: YdcF family protein [Leptolyngbyaceae cyanobacterium]
MVLLADVFLLLTQVLLGLIVAGVIWYFLKYVYQVFSVLPRFLLGWAVVLLVAALLSLSFWRGAPQDSWILDFLWRIISFPLRPFGLGLILLTILLTGKVPSKLVRNGILVTLIILALGSLPIVAHFLVQELEMEAIEVIQPAPPLPADARRVIVLLGSGTTRFQLKPPTESRPASPPKVERPLSLDAIEILGKLPIQLTESGDLILYAAQLYREEADKGNRPLVIVSAGQYRGRRQKTGEKSEDISETRAIQTLLTDKFGVPSSDILMSYDGSPSIHRSAVGVEKVLKDQRVNDGNQLMLVNSAISMNRAFLTFRKVFEGKTIVARPADFITIPTRSSLSKELQGKDLIEIRIQPSDFLPASDAFCLSSKAIEEYLTSLFYFLRGWIMPFQPTR